MTRQIKPGGENHEVSDSTPNVRPNADNAGEASGDESGTGHTGQIAAGDVGPENLTGLQAENAELKDRLLRALAEVENVRRRAERDLSNRAQYAIAKFAGDMVSVAENFHRFTGSIPAKARESEATVKTLIEGVELTEKEMLRSLEKHGVKKLDPLGERFDPNFHEAMFEVPDPSVPNGTIARVLEAGYSIGTRALRPAKVGVTSGGIQRGTAGPQGEPQS